MECWGSSTSRLGHVCFMSARKQFIHQELARWCGILILGWHFVCVGRLSKPFWWEGAEPNWESESHGYTRTSPMQASQHTLFLLILKRREVQEEFSMHSCRSADIQMYTLRECVGQHIKRKMSLWFPTLVPSLGKFTLPRWLTYKHRSSLGSLQGFLWDFISQ